MATITSHMETSETVVQKPLVHYFDPASTRTVAAGEVIHDYYGVPLWLMEEYLSKLNAIKVDEGLWERSGCLMELKKAPIKRIGSLEVGGTTMEFTGTEGTIQQVLTDLEWKTLRCG